MCDFFLREEEGRKGGRERERLMEGGEEGSREGRRDRRMEGRRATGRKEGGREKKMLCCTWTCMTVLICFDLELQWRVMTVPLRKETTPLPEREKSVKNTSNCFRSELYMYNSVCCV